MFKKGILCLFPFVLSISNSSLAQNLSFNAVTELKNWQAEVGIPGVIDPQHTDSSTRVYSQLNRFLFNNNSLSGEEIKNIPKKISDILTGFTIRYIQSSNSSSGCGVQNKIYFMDELGGLRLSNSPSPALKGFEAGLVLIDSEICIAGAGKIPQLTSKLANLFLSPQFRGQALKDAKRVWKENSASPNICEHLKFSFGFIDLGTSIYCLEPQIKHFSDISFLQMWGVSNGLRSEGLTIPVFFNQTLGVFQKRGNDLYIKIIAATRGFGASGVSRDMAKDALQERQNHLVNVLKGYAR